MLSDNWVVKNLENALGTWNEKLAELWQLITQTPESFKGGQIWSVITDINTALVGIGYGLLVLFFAMGIFSAAASFRELQRPEFALRHFIRFLLAKIAVGYGMEIMTAIFSICGGVAAAVMSGIGGAVTETATLPTEIVNAIDDVGFLQSIPLWLVSFLGSLFITVTSFILILTVYGRFFKLYIYTALSPLPLAAFAGETTSGIPRPPATSRSTCRGSRACPSRRPSSSGIAAGRAAWRRRSLRCIWQASPCAVWRTSPRRCGAARFLLPPSAS